MKLHKLFSAFVSKDTLMKPSLCGVYWDAPAMTLVATDGHRMIMVTGEPVVEGPSAIIPLEAFRETDKDKSEPMTRIVVSDDAKEVTVYSPRTGKAIMSTIDERYPDYQSVIPNARRYQGAQLPALLDAKYLGQIMAAFAAQGGPEWGKVLIRFGGPEAAAVFEVPEVEGCNVSGFIMPVRSPQLRVQLEKEVEAQNGVN